MSLGPVLSPEACAPRYPHQPGGKERERDRDRDTLSRTRSLSLTTLSLSPALCLSPARSHHTTNMTQPRHVSYRQPTCPGGTNSRRRGSSGSQGLRANHSAPHVTNAMHGRGGARAGARAVGGALTAHAVVHLWASTEHLGLRHDGRTGEERAELRRQLAAHGNDGEQLHTSKRHTHTDRTSRGYAPDSSRLNIPSICIPARWPTTACCTSHTHALANLYHLLPFRTLKILVP